MFRLMMLFFVLCAASCGGKASDSKHDVASRNLSPKVAEIRDALEPYETAESRYGPHNEAVTHDLRINAIACIRAASVVIQEVKNFRVALQEAMGSGVAAKSQEDADLEDYAVEIAFKNPAKAEGSTPSLDIDALKATVDKFKTTTADAAKASIDLKAAFVGTDKFDEATDKVYADWTGRHLAATLAFSKVIEIFDELKVACQDVVARGHCQGEAFLPEKFKIIYAGALGGITFLRPTLSAEDLNSDI